MLGHFRKRFYVECFLAAAGVAVLIFGWIVGNDPTSARWIGYALTFIGTLLGSAATGWAFGIAASEISRNEELKFIGSHLGTALAQISQSVRLGLQYPGQCRAYFIAIDQDVGSLSNIIDDLNRITGKRLEVDVKTIAQIKKSISESGSELDRNESDLPVVGSNKGHIQNVISGDNPPVSHSSSATMVAPPSDQTQEKKQGVRLFSQ